MFLMVNYIEYMYNTLIHTVKSMLRSYIYANVSNLSQFESPLASPNISKQIARKAPVVDIKHRGTILTQLCLIE